MPKVIYITPQGERHEVEVENGYSIMEGAINNNIEGIVAECGGAAMCGTCHCYVIEAAEGALPDPAPNEADTIEFLANEPKENSRLPCQIKVTPLLEGAVFEVATGR